MTNEEIFEEFTVAKSLGRRLDVNRLPPARASIYAVETQRARSIIRGAVQTAPTMPGVHFDWIKDESVNACAFRHRGMYFIGMNSGVVSIVNRIFGRMLSDPRVLPRVGDASKEDAARVPPHVLPTPPAQLRASDINAVMPHDTDRGIHCYYLAQTAKDFILSHEITHVIHGHVAYRMDRLGLPCVPEVRWTRGTGEPPLTRQTLEMDADMGAAANEAGNVIGAVMDKARRPGPPLDRYYQDPERAMFDFAFGICPFFRIFGDDFLPPLNADKLLYPPFRVRQMIAIATSAYFISRRWGTELADRCQEAMAEAMLQVEDAWSKMTGEPLRVKGLREAWDGTGWGHVRDKLIAHWRTDLRPELLPFTHIELPEA